LFVLDFCRDIHVQTQKLIPLPVQLWQTLTEVAQLTPFYFSLLLQIPAFFLVMKDQNF